MPQQIRKKKIRDVLVKIFIDGSEYVKTSFSRGFIEARIKKMLPSAVWHKDIYPFFTKGRKILYESYNGSNQYVQFINIEYTDKRAICVEKYDALMKEMCNNHELPIFLDRDVREYRVIYDLPMFEQIFGDMIISAAKGLKNRLTIMAKTGAKLPSGRDSRDLLRDTINPLKELELRKME